MHARVTEGKVANLADEKKPVRFDRFKGTGKYRGDNLCDPSSRASRKSGLQAAVRLRLEAAVVCAAFIAVLVTVLKLASTTSAACLLAFWTVS